MKAWRSLPANEREAHGEPRNTTWSPRLHSPRCPSCSAISSNGSLLPPRLSFVFERGRPTMDDYLCTQVLLKRTICEQWPFPRCPNRKLAPQLLFAEPVSVRAPRCSGGAASGPGAHFPRHRPQLPGRRPSRRGGAPKLPPLAPPPRLRPPGSKARASASSLPTPYSLGHENRIGRQGCLPSLIGHEFHADILIWALFERCNPDVRDMLPLSCKIRVKWP